MRAIKRRNGRLRRHTRMADGVRASHVNKG